MEDIQPIEPYGSQDNIADVLDILRKSEVYFILAVGIIGEKRTILNSGGFQLEDLPHLVCGIKEQLAQPNL